MAYCPIRGHRLTLAEVELLRTVLPIAFKWFDLEIKNLADTMFIWKYSMKTKKLSSFTSNNIKYC